MYKCNVQMYILRYVQLHFDVFQGPNRKGGVEPGGQGGLVDFRITWTNFSGLVGGGRRTCRLGCLSL